MSDILVIEQPRETGEWGEDGHLQLTRVFVLKSDDRIPLISVLAHPDIPKRYTVHPDATAAMCTRVAPTRRSPGNRLWEVTCYYTTDWLHDVENPLDRRAEISWRDTEHAVAAMVDLDGKPFVSASGEQLEDVHVESPGEICTIVKHLPSMPGWFADYRNAVNEFDITIDGLLWLAGQCRIKSRQLSGWKRENDIDYRTLTLEIHMRPEGWQRQYLNRGFYELVSEEQQVEPEDDEDEPTTVTVVKRKRIQVDGKGAVEPQLLDKNGKAIEFTDKDGEPIPAAAEKVQEAVLDFKVRQVRDYSILPLE